MLTIEDRRERRRARNYLIWKKNKERYNAQKREFYQKNKEMLAARNRAWVAANPEKVREMRRNCGRGLKRLRFEIFIRDNFRCVYCGRNGQESVLQIDHRHPRSKGGTNSPDNLVTACLDCNTGKGDALLELIKLK